MRIVIVTIIDPTPNYGNRLQHYAVKKVLKDLFNVDAKSLAIDLPTANIKNDCKRLLHKMLNYRKTTRKEYWKYQYPKIKKFNAFDKKYFNIVYAQEINQIPIADYYVVGSDQVWNPEWYDRNPLKKDVFLLTFAKPEQKVCFSPSIALDELPAEWVPWFQKQLCKFPTISVREEAGARIVNELTGKKAEVLIDPTLMLAADEWRKIERKPSQLRKEQKYILTYFLGELGEEAKEETQRLSREENLDIIELMNPFSPFFISDPGEFIYLIEHSKIVLTDSFHACVFSFIFEKPFLVFERKGKECSMMSRIDTLLKMTGLQRKRYRDVPRYSTDELFECDYKSGYTILIEEKKKVYEFLSNCIGGAGKKNENI